MKQENIHAVTGAFGYSGKYITRRLLADGKTVVTLTAIAVEQGKSRENRVIDAIGPETFTYSGWPRR